MLLVKNYKFETIYGENLTGYMEQITQLERYQTISDSDYKERLQDQGISISLFGSDWIFTLFTPYLPLDSTVSSFTYSGSS